MKKFILTLILATIPFTTFASVELFQIVAFGWDSSTQKLSVVSMGSGTAIEKDLILTNKHVVQVDDKIADFVVLCQADAKRTKGVKCEIPAGVVSVHPDFDAALIKPLSSHHYFPSVRVVSGEASIGTQVRLAGFPVPLEGTQLQGFGGTKTLEAVEDWVAGSGGPLEFEGDELTITRGNVVNKGLLSATGGRYLVTDAKVNFGNSGGAAFDQYGAYVGIPTLKDLNDNAYVLSYYQLQTWVKTAQTLEPVVLGVAHDFYNDFSAKTLSKTTAKRSYQASRAPSSTSISGVSASANSTANLSIKERLKLRREGRTASAASTTATSTRSRYRSSSARYNGYSSYRDYYRNYYLNR